MALAKKRKILTDLPEEQEESKIEKPLKSSTPRRKPSK